MSTSAAGGRQALLRSEPEAAARTLEVHAEEKVAPDFSQITIPTLVLHGAADNIIPLEAAKTLAAALPAGRLETIPDAGHVPTMTRPTEVVDAVEQWWQSVAAKP